MNLFLCLVFSSEIYIIDFYASEFSRFFNLDEKSPLLYTAPTYIINLFILTIVNQVA